MSWITKVTTVLCDKSLKLCNNICTLNWKKSACWNNEITSFYCGFLHVECLHNIMDLEIEYLWLLDLLDFWEDLIRILIRLMVRLRRDDVLTPAKKAF